MRRFLLISTIAFAIILLGTHSTYGQSSAWHLVNSQSVPQVVGYVYQISPDGRFVFEYDYASYINDTTALSKQPIAQTRGTATRWQNGTILYQEFSSKDFPPPNCSDSTLLPVDFYNASTQSQQLFCLNAPKISLVERSPFDNYVLFGDNRYLIDLKANTVRDLQGQLTTQVSTTDTKQWFANDQTWWNAQTGLPMARVNEFVKAGADYTKDDDAEMLQLCPMASQNCQPIVSVQQYVHGNLTDDVLSFDGQTLLWSAYQTPTTEVIHTGAHGTAINQDLVAFATDIQTGATTEIFRLSQHNTSTAKAARARWSTDGNVLAINMENPTLTTGADAQFAIFLATFSGPPSTVKDIQAEVAICVPDHGIATSLNKKIDHQDWNPFINEVEAQSGKKIDKPCADQMITIATFFLTNPPPTPTSSK